MQNFLIVVAGDEQRITMEYFLVHDSSFCLNIILALTMLPHMNPTWNCGQFSKEDILKK